MNEEIFAARIASGTMSASNPLVQLAWDSTSLGRMKDCPRKYWLSIGLGWVPKRRSVDLRFGILYHQAHEKFQKFLAAGFEHYEAVHATVSWLLLESWNQLDNLPNNPLGDNHVKCRFTLIRTFVWWTEQHKEDSIRTLILPSGKPAVELSFRYAIGLDAPTGEPVLVSGHLDRVGYFLNEGLWVIDYKSTKNSVDNRYFEQFTPDNQMSQYSSGAPVVLSEPVKGVMVDAAQVGVNFSRFARQSVPRSRATLEEWSEERRYWINTAHALALTYGEKTWPGNDKHCFLCEFRKTYCSKDPKVRESFLKTSFVQEPWDPLEAR